MERELLRATAVSTRHSTPDAGGTRLEEQRREAEREAVRQALSRAGNNRTMAARLLGISRRTLYNKLDELGLTAP